MRYLQFDQYALKEAEEDEEGNVGSFAMKKYVKFLTKLSISPSGAMDEIQEEVDNFCTELKIKSDEFQHQCLYILHEFFGAGTYLKATKEREVEIDQKELKAGIKSEMEHTTNELIAKKIAMDHLAECPNYYTRLAKLEKECKEDSPQSSESKITLDKDEKSLLLKLKKVDDKTLLSWCGYSSKKDFEDETDEIYSKEAIVQSNYEDILANLK